MKRAFLLIVASALLVALGFAQTPAASINADQTIKGCLEDSDGNYTVVEDVTGHIFKISTTSVDFKQHLGHDVTLIGHKASGASSAAADNSFAVTELNMISEHCAAVAAAPIAAIGTPSETATTPSAVPDAPVATTRTFAQTEIIPVAPAATTVTAPAETTVPPATDAVAIVNTPLDKPVAAAADRTRPPAPSRRLSATSAAVATTPAAAASTPPESVSTPDAAAVTPAATTSTPPQTASAPDAAPTTPAAPARHRAPFLLILLAVLVIVMGTLVPFLGRWRKRKLLERTGAENLSFTREASSDQGKSDPQEPRKAA